MWCSVFSLGAFEAEIMKALLLEHLFLKAVEYCALAEMSHFTARFRHNKHPVCFSQFPVVISPAYYGDSCGTLWLSTRSSCFPECSLIRLFALTPGCHS